MLEFEPLFHAHRDRIFQLALRVTGSAARAEDVCQEVFLRALEKLSGFREESQAYTWLHRITINLCIDHMRRDKRFSPPPAAPSEDGPAADPMESLPDPSRPHADLLEEAELLRLIRDAIARMRPKYRDVIILRELQALSHEEIARILGISLKAVGVRLIRARNQLKSKIERYL